MSQHSQNQSKYQDFSANIKDFKIIKQVETKDISSVYLVQNVKTGEEFSAKVINNSQKEPKTKQAINSEIGILIRCQHPTLINFIGYSFKDFEDQKNVTIFTEFAKKGSLADLLQKLQKGKSKEIYDNTSRQILMVGISRGMMYLHLHQIIHKNLKPSNILLDQKLHPHISDFYSAAIQSPQSANSVYTAPEILKGKQCSGKADVYSFGIIMFEIITDTPAYPLFTKGKMTALQLAKKVISENYRPKFPAGVKKSIQQLIEKCWSKDPKERPTFDEIFKKLGFNIENIYADEDSEEIYDDDYKYYLEDVDPVDVIEYAESISSQISASKKDKDLEDKITKIEEKIEMLINPLKAENAMLKEEKEEMNKKIEMLEKENKEIKEKIDQIEKKLSDKNFVEKPAATPEPEKVTLNSFNNLSIKAQQSFIAKGQIEKTNPFFSKVKLVANYLSKFNLRETSTYFQVGNQEDTQDSIIDINNNENRQLQFLSNSTDLFLKHNSFNSTEFLKLIDQFNIVSFDMKYPSTNFKNDYKTILKLKKSKGDRIRISLFITGLAETDQAFNDDSNINYIKLDGKTKPVNKIREYSFSGCTNLNEIFIPTSVSAIGSYAFNGCTSLTGITIPTSITEISEGTFVRCSTLIRIVIPKSVSSIGPSAFKGCTSLIDVRIPSSVAIIGDSAFEECTSLSHITIPSSVTKLEASLFKKCTSLNDVVLPESIVKIGRGAFYRCTSMTQISLPASIVDIGQYAFAECHTLSKINLPTIKEIKSKTFEGCKSLYHVSIPFSVTAISRGAFNGCNSLKKISIPSSVSVIEDGSFPENTETVTKVLA